MIQTQASLLTAIFYHPHTIYLSLMLRIPLSSLFNIRVRTIRISLLNLNSYLKGLKLIQYGKTCDSGKKPFLSLFKMKLSKKLVKARKIKTRL